MAFKFRLETNLRISGQILEAAQGILAEEIRIFNKISEERRIINDKYNEVIKRQKIACIKEPYKLDYWQKFSSEQKRQLDNKREEEKNQENIVSSQREEVIRLKIEHEKFEKLKEKQYKLFIQEELRKEQKVIDEISQYCSGISEQEASV